MRHRDDDSPVGNRDARYVLNVTGAWEHTGLPRLAQVKTAWDPDHVFCTNRNIAPG